MFNEEYSEEYQTSLWKAGEVAPAGTYIRIDAQPYRTVTLDDEGPLPATFDGHIAFYCVLPKINLYAKRVQQELVISY
jgi:hypothetical protein